MVLINHINYRYNLFVIKKNNKIIITKITKILKQFNSFLVKTLHGNSVLRNIKQETFL